MSIERESEKTVTERADAIIAERSEARTKRRAAHRAKITAKTEERRKRVEDAAKDKAARIARRAGR